MANQIKFSTQANLDYIEAVNFYFENGTELTQKIDDSLIDVLEIIQTSPELFSKFKEASSYRRTHLLKFKTIPIYQIIKNQNIILTVAKMHNFRNPYRLAKRLT